MVPYRDLNPRVTVRSLFFETAETLTFYLDIILFENVPAQIANGVFSHSAAASSTLLHVDPALRHTRYKGQLVRHAIRFGSRQAGGASRLCKAGPLMQMHQLKLIEIGKIIFVISIVHKHKNALCDVSIVVYNSSNTYRT